MQDTSPSTEIASKSDMKEAAFCFVISNDLSEHSAQLLRMAKTAFPGLDIAALTDLPAARADAIGGPLVVPVLTPAQSLAVLIGQGQAPAQALKNWIEAAQRRLSEYRNARRQIKLLALGPLLEGSEKSWKTLAALTGQDAPACLPEKATEQPQDGDMLYHLIGAYLLRSSPVAKVIADEIEAMIHGPLPAEENDLHCAAAVLDHAQAQQTSLNTLSTEGDLLKQNLALLVNDIEKMSTRQSTLESELSSMTELEARLSQTSGALLQAQKKATDAQNALRDLEQHHGRLSHDTKAVSEALEQILASTSWKITGPLRKIVSRLRSQ